MYKDTQQPLHTQSQVTDTPCKKVNSVSGRLLGSAWKNLPTGPSAGECAGIKFQCHPFKFFIYSGERLIPELWYHARRRMLSAVRINIKQLHHHQPAGVSVSLSPHSTRSGQDICGRSTHGFGPGGPAGCAISDVNQHPS